MPTSNILTFRDLYTQVLTYLDKPSDTGQGLAMAKYAIQTANEKRLTEDRWSFMLWPTYITFPFVTGKRSYILHPLLNQIVDFTNSTSQQIMKETPSRARYKVGVQDSRYHYEWVKNAPVSAQPTAPYGLLTVIGSAQITYIDDAGNLMEEEISSGSTASNCVEVIQVTKTDVGPLQLIANGGATILRLLQETQNLTPRYGIGYPQITLFGDGVTGETGKYRFYKKPGNLIHANDITDIPYPYSRILVYDALLEMQAYNDSATHAYWLKQQSELDMQMRQAYQEGETEGSESRTIHEVDTYNG